MSENDEQPLADLEDIYLVDVDMGSYLSKHDVVYRSPPREGWEGFPLGNGAYGGMWWATDDGLIFQANHTDALEEPDPDSKNEGWAVLRSCGRMVVKHPFPIHDWAYVNEYSGILSLHSAQVKTEVAGAFGSFATRFYIHADHPVAVLTYKADYAGALEQKGAPVRIEVERWGSRVFGWWYNSIQGGAGMDIGDTDVSVDGGDICIVASFRGGTTALRCRIVGADANGRVVHDRMGEFEIPAAPRQEFTVLLACVTSRQSADPMAAAGESLDRVGRLVSAEEADTGHKAWWAAFWRRSFLSVSPDYAENLYYVHLYLMGSSCRGNYPPYFNGGIWIWNHDIRNWVNPLHWNEQQSFWCLPAANRGDFLMSYLNTYERNKPEALRVTQERGFKGLRWSENNDFTGRQLGLDSSSFGDNHTPASQIALFFWWHYRFTYDIGYFEEVGFPFIDAVGDFFLDFITWNDDRGEYEIPPASTYEEERPFRFTNSITTLSMAKRIFSILEEAFEMVEADVDPTKREQWRHVLEHLPEYTINDRDAVRGPTLASGFLDGGELPERETHNHGPLFCPVFPAGEIDLAMRNDELFAAAYNTLATYPPCVLAINQTVVVAARLGMSGLAERNLLAMIRQLQHFPNGQFFNIDHWHMYSRRVEVDLERNNDTNYWAARGYVADDTAKYQRDYLEDRGCKFQDVRVLPYEPDGVAEHRVDTPADPFSQMGMESLGNFAAGMQEMLLQSHGGVIRIFPAIPDHWEGAFCLAAEGGFLVSSNRSPHRDISSVEIFSTRGGSCDVVAPWPGGIRIVQLEATTGNPDVDFRIEARGADSVVSFSTEKGKSYALLPEGRDVPGIRRFSAEPNKAPKRYLEATLGKASEW